MRGSNKEIGKSIILIKDLYFKDKDNAHSWSSWVGNPVQDSKYSYRSIIFAIKKIEFLREARDGLRLDK